MTPLHWITPEWTCPAGTQALTTCRNGGVSKYGWAGLNLATHVGDDPHATLRNRQILRDQAGLPSEPIWLDQQHSNRVFKDGAAELTASSLQGIVADACFTDRPNRICAVLTADCLPILVASPGSVNGDPQIAAIHAGWRGLAQGIIEKTLALFNHSLTESSAWIGPAISAANYCVDEPMRRRFIALNPDNQAFFIPVESRQPRPQWQMDLAGIARQQLYDAGIKQVYSSGLCNYEDHRFYSYRRDRDTGRMATLIWRTNTNQGD